MGSRGGGDVVGISGDKQALEHLDNKPSWSNVDFKLRHGVWFARGDLRPSLRPPGWG